MLIDTHCHLDFKDFDSDRDLVINRAAAAGVGIIINVASSLEGSRRAVELAERYNCIYASVGAHPHEAGKVDKGTFSELKKLASLSASPAEGGQGLKVVAVGEVGLDYYRDLSPRDTQKKVFREFILLARELGLPLILHNRDASEDMLSVLKSEFVKTPVRGVMHCFSQDTVFLKKCLDIGLYVSFTCNITFKNAGILREVVKYAPMERVLLETDAPFLAPQEYRGKRNEPAYLKLLVEELSRIHSVDIDTIARTTTHNANELFSLGIEEEARIAYQIRDSLYLNITNRCTNDCCFCVRSFTDFVKGHNLKLGREPSAKEVISELKGLERYKEVVFCGYGEPTLRLDALKEIARFLKEKGRRVRLVTNGHGSLINKRPIAAELAGLVDKVSVSLNVDTEEKYNKICKPQFGKGAFEDVKHFIVECKAAGLDIEVTCLDIPETDTEKCKFLVEQELGAEFRLRRHNVVG